MHRRDQGCVSAGSPAARDVNDAAYVCAYLTVVCRPVSDLLPSSLASVCSVCS